MRLGAIFPQTEIGADPSAVKDFAQAAEDLGYEHLLVFDHVLGADQTKRDGWDRPYNKDDMFHEPFVMFGYLGAITEKLEFTTGVLILGQRQTSLVAKQAARLHEYWTIFCPDSRSNFQILSDITCRQFGNSHPNSFISFSLNEQPSFRLIKITNI